MSVQLSTAVRNARLDAVQTAVGTGPLLNIYSGSPPANCAASETGTLLCSITLPSTWMAGAAGGAKAMAGTRSATASAAGTAGHFRLLDSTGTTCHAQGTVTATGGGGDMTVGSTTISPGLTVGVTQFTLTDANS